MCIRTVEACSDRNQLHISADNIMNVHDPCSVRVAYKSRQPAKFAGFSARFRQLLSLLHESKYVEEMDPQPSTFHKTPAT